MTKTLHKLHWDSYYESELVSIVWVVCVYVSAHGCVVPVSDLVFWGVFCLARLLFLRWIKGEGAPSRLCWMAEILKGCLQRDWGK